MKLLVLADLPDVLDEWRQAAAQAAPWIHVLANEDVTDPASVDAALVLAPPPGRLRQLPRLRIIFSLGAGVEHLASDPFLPDVPIVKLMSPAKQRLMNEWLFYAVLRYHRGFDQFERLQRQALWQHQGPGPMAEDVRITVLGLGDLGGNAAKMLSDHGFKVSGWSRSPKSIPGVHCAHGDEGLKALLPRSDILICLLPLTDQTRGLLGANLFAKLPRGAVIINAGRGQQVVSDDLLRALDSGQLRAAMLDVTDPEPLPPEHPFWSHPQITITPHAAAYMPHQQALPSLVDNYQRLIDGRPLSHIVEPHLRA